MTFRLGPALALFVSLSATFACTSPSDDDASTASALAGTYRVDVQAPGAIEPGATTPLTLRVLGAGDAPVTAFDDLHTQPMHVVAISSDLRDFVHVHPTLGASGALSVDVPFSVAQPYAMFFEYDPAGPDGAQLSRATIRPNGAEPKSPELSRETAFDGRTTLAATVGGTRVELAALAHPMIMPNMATTFRAVVKTAAGDPATDLVDWLGMPAHAIAISEDQATFIHAHGMRPGSGGHGGHGGHGEHGGTTDAGAAPNDLDINVTFPAAGLYKLFVQVKRGDAIVTAPFVVRVRGM